MYQTVIRLNDYCDQKKGIIKAKNIIISEQGKLCLITLGKIKVILELCVQEENSTWL